MQNKFEKIKSLCDTLDQLPGIVVCLHEIYNGKPKIYFKMDTTQIGPVILSRCLSKRYYQTNWEVVLSDTECEPSFILETTTDVEDVWQAVGGLIRNLQQHIQDDFDIMSNVRHLECARRARYGTINEYDIDYDEIIKLLKENVGISPILISDIISKSSNPQEVIKILMESGVIEFKRGSYYLK